MSMSLEYNQFESMILTCPRMRGASGCSSVAVALAPCAVSIVVILLLGLVVGWQVEDVEHKRI
jgi:hypothetical protein